MTAAWWRKQRRDQALHFGASLALVGVARLAGAEVSLLAAAWLGLGGWAIREFTEWQLAPPGSGRPWSRGSLIDLVGWLPGGPAALGLELLLARIF